LSTGSAPVREWATDRFDRYWEWATDRFDRYWEWATDRFDRYWERTTPFGPLAFE